MKIAPSILNADFGYLADAVQQAQLACLADWIATRCEAAAASAATPAKVRTRRR